MGLCVCVWWWWWAGLVGLNSSSLLIWPFNDGCKRASIVPIASGLSVEPKLTGIPSLQAAPGTGLVAEAMVAVSS